MDLKVNMKWIVSATIVVFLLLIVLNHFFKDLFKLNPYYRNKILLEGFDASGNAPASTTSSSAPAAEPTINETDKSTIMSELFEKVNQQTDTIRTLKLSDKFSPINIDKTATEPYLILTNLKLLINNGIYKNEIDLMELYNQYIGNKEIKVIMSDINSVNMESSDKSNIGSLETSFLTKSKSIVDGHQKIIDKIIENKNKE
jgi:hypothetical protein